MKIHPGHPSLLRPLAAVAALAFAACTEDRSAEIGQLEEELELVRDDLRIQREMAERTEERLETAHQELAEVKGRLRTTEREFSRAERELERYRRKEEAAMAAAEAKPDAREMRAAAKETVETFRDRMVSISGDQHQGSGLLVEADDKIWLYAPRSAIEGNTKLEITTAGGTALKSFGAFEVATGAPLVRLEVVEDELAGIPLEQAAEASDRNTLLLALDPDSGVVEGRSYGGDGRARLDSRLGALAPGSAVFDGETGRLSGMILPAGNEEISLWPQRHHAGRETAELLPLDPDIAWSAVPIGSFLKEARLLAQTDENTRLIHAFANTRADTSGVSYGSLPGGMGIDELFREHGDDPAVRSLRQLDAWLKENAARSAQTDIQREIRSVFSQIDATARRHERELANTRFSQAHAKAAARSLQWQQEAREELDKRLREFE